MPPFRAGSAFTVGVEEQLHVVAPDTLAPYHATDCLRAGPPWPGGHAKGEIGGGVIEFVTPVCDTAAGAVETLCAMRAEAVSRGVALLGAGLHPAARLGVRHGRARRDESIADRVRGVMRQTPHCGVHVHVGMPDGETAIRACNGLRSWMPLLMALSASSPFWYGQDSRLASARSVISNSFPVSGIPRLFEDYADFEATVAALAVVGDCPDYSLIWWDVRPHPRLGTVEIRIFDAQSSPDDLAAVVALAHCLAVHEACAPPGAAISAEALRAMSFAAARDGLAARVPCDGTLVPAANAAIVALTLVGHNAVDLGCWDELMLVQRILERGNGADRQRAAAADGGLRGVLSLLAAETMGTAGTRDAGSLDDLRVVAG